MLRSRADGPARAPLFHIGAESRVAAGMMRNKVSRELFAYWDALRGARAAPERACFNPGAISAILADTFLIEVDAEGLFPLRVVGTRVNAIRGAELKGTSFLDLWRQEDRQSVHAALVAVVDGVAPLVGGARMRAPGDAQVDLEFLLLPMRHFGKTHSRVLGAISPARAVEWMAAGGASPLEFLSMRIVDAAQAVPLQPPAQSGRRPRLVISNPEKS